MTSRGENICQVNSKNNEQGKAKLAMYCYSTKLEKYTEFAVTLVYKSQWIVLVHGENEN